MIILATVTVVVLLVVMFYNDILKHRCSISSLIAAAGCLLYPLLDFAVDLQS